MSNYWNWINRTDIEKGLSKPKEWPVKPLPGDHYSTYHRLQLIPGCTCGDCTYLDESVPGGLWCVRYHGLGEREFKKRRQGDLLAYLELEVSGYVYLLQAGHYYKIGRAKNPGERIKTLAIQLPFPVDVVLVMPCDDEIAAEKYLHKYYSHRRSNGEWFELTDSDVLWMQIHHVWAYEGFYV